MPAIRVKENEPFDVALRRFKRSCEKAGVLTEVRRREAYEKPTAERKRKAAAAVKRHLKKLSKEGGRMARSPHQRRREPHTRMSSSALKDRIQDAMKTAMKSGDKERLAVIRLIMSALKQIEVDERIELDDSRVLSVLDKMVKQRRESISQFKSGGRDDLVDKEQAEIDVITEFLPQALTAEEIETIINRAISDTGASSMKDMGKVMGLVKPQITGRADVGAVSQKIKSLLG